MKILKHEWFIRAKSSGQSKEVYYQVKSREIANFETGSHSEFSSITTGNNSGNIQIEYLEPAKDEMYFCIPACKDGCTYMFKLPVGVERGGVILDPDIGRFDNIKSPYFKPNPQYGFFIPPEVKPAFVVYNNTGETVTPKLWFQVVKYELLLVEEQTIIDDLDNGKLPYTQIDLGGLNIV